MMPFLLLHDSSRTIDQSPGLIFFFFSIYKVIIVGIAPRNKPGQGADTGLPRIQGNKRGDGDPGTYAQDWICAVPVTDVSF